MKKGVWDVFEETVETKPHKTSLVYLGVEYSYSELRNLCERLASSLSAMGVKKGKEL